MPYNGVGLFTSLGAPTFPAVPNTYILASYFNATMNDIFTGLSSVMTRDGQSPMTANLSMGGNKVTGLGAGTNPTDSVCYSQVFNSPTITSPTLSNPVFIGVPLTPTAVPGTNTTQVASTAFVLNQAMSATLPSQPGNAKKFITTDGTSARWDYVGAGNAAQSISALVVQATSGQFLALTNATAQAAATNLLLYSEQDDNAAWTKGNTTITANAIASPDGATTADKLVESTAPSAYHTFAQAVASLSSGLAYTLSMYVKAAGRSAVAFGFDNTGSFSAGYQYGKFDLSTGVATAFLGSPTVSMELVGDGWYRCIVTATTNAAGTATIDLLLVNGAATQYTGDGSSGVYVWGAQCEQAGAATSYIQTTSATVTRAAGVVAPQRVVLPTSPSTDAWVKTVVANGIVTNVIDPNGQTIEGTAGPMTLDKSSGSVELQFINSSWRLV